MDLMKNTPPENQMKKWFKMTFNRTHGEDERYYKTWKHRFEKGPRTTWQNADFRTRKYLLKCFPKFKGLTINDNLMNEEFMVQAKYDWW